MEAHRNPLGDEESRRMRKPLLHDGPIVNVTTLAESRYNDSFPRTGSPLDRFLVLEDPKHTSEGIRGCLDGSIGTGAIQRTIQHIGLYWLSTEVFA